MNINNNKAWLLYKNLEKIEVTVNPQFYSTEKNMNQNVFTWVYDVKIENFGVSTIQLTRRYWQIFDGLTKIREIEDEGIVGQQPIIRPNELFEYSSQVTLFSDSGLMLGKYLALDMLTGEKFSINIPAFSLDSFTDRKLVN